MIFQYGAHLEDDMLPYQECYSDDDCASKCARCSAEGVCVSICGSNERCRQDILTGSQVCCTSDRWAGPYCCPSTMNGYCCNVVGDQCCPWFKPLIDKNGKCYTCEEETGVDVTDVNENCNACPNREIWNNKCVLKCEGELRDTNGKCHSCDEKDPIVINEAMNMCADACPNRVANGRGNLYCSLPCPEGTFTGRDGKCYSCDEGKNIDNWDVQHDGCERCENRILVGNYCILKCPKGEIRGDDGKCYDCNEINPIVINEAMNMCTDTCPNRVANGRGNLYCSLPCPEGTFTGRDGKCYSCDEGKNIDNWDVQHDGCERCENRILVGNYCILKCPKGEIRGDDGKCYDCNEINPIVINEAMNMCTDTCPNRVANGRGNLYCSLPCPEGTFTGRDGKCYSCDEGKNIDNWDVQHDGCERCPDTRNKYNNYCVPKCPADAPLRGADNKCYPCDTEERVNVADITDACMECYEERTLDGNYCVLKE